MMSFSFSSDKGGAGGISWILQRFMNTFSSFTFFVLIHIPGVGVTLNIDMMYISELLVDAIEV